MKAYYSTKDMNQEESENYINYIKLGQFLNSNHKDKLEWLKKLWQLGESYQNKADEINSLILALNQYSETNQFKSETSKQMFTALLEQACEIYSFIDEEIWRNRNVN